MSKPDKWMPLHVDKYLGDTMSLSTLQHGAYCLLLMAYWKSGPLPDDDAALANIAKMDSKTWAKNRALVRQYFSLGDDGLLHQKRADIERDKASKISTVRREAVASRADRQPQKPGPNGGNGATTNVQKAYKPDTNVATNEPTIVGTLYRGTKKEEEVAASYLDSVPPREAAPAADSVVPFRLKLSDPPARWLAETREREKVFDPAAGLFSEVSCAGSCLDVRGAALDICLAAGMDPASHCDWRPLIRWLEAGADFAMDIMPEVRKRAARPGYAPPSTLAYFDDEMSRLAILRREEPERVRLEMAYYDRLKAKALSGGDA